MIYLSISLFALAAVFGIFMLTRWVAGKNVNRSVIFSHGIAAVIGFLLLIYYAIRHGDSFPKISIVLFAIAAVVGLYMFIGDLRKKPHPLALAVTHGLVAVIGFITLLYFVFV